MQQGLVGLGTQGITQKQWEMYGIALKSNVLLGPAGINDSVGVIKYLIVSSSQKL